MSLSSVEGLAALRIPDFRNYLSAGLLASLAGEMQSVAVSWQVYQLTGSFSKLAFIGLAQFAPFVLLVLFAGHAADRYDRARIINLCMAVQLVGSAILLAYMHGNGMHAIWPVYLVMTLLGTARAFEMPAVKAIVINLVPAGNFANATAIRSSTFEIATIAGPVLGGFLYLIGPGTVYGLALALTSVATLLMLRVRSRQTRVANPAPMNVQSALEGLHFVRTRPIVLGAISLDLFAVLFGGCVAVLPAYASDVLHVGPQALGFLRTAPAVGALIMGGVLAFFPIQRHVGRWMFIGVLAFGVSTIVFGLSHNLWLSLLMLLVLGGGDMVSVYIRQMLVQLETPDAVRGRVSAVSSMFIGASNEFGEFESGMMASAFGLIPSVVLGGFATLVVAVLWARLFPALRRVDSFHAKPAETADTL